MSNISNTDIAQTIYQLSKEKNGDDTATLKNVIKFLVRKRLINKTEGILRSLDKIINKEKGIIEAKVTGAKKISDEIKKEIIRTIKKRYLANDVILEEKLDSKLLGGVRIEVGDEVADLSVKNKIGKLQDYLIRKI